MSAGEDYVRVKGAVMEIRSRSVLFAVGDSVKRGSWIPRSVLHGVDDKALDGRRGPFEIALRIMRWKAEECGFTDGRIDDGADDDLFGDKPSVDQRRSSEVRRSRWS